MPLPVLNFLISSGVIWRSTIKLAFYSCLFQWTIILDQFWFQFSLPGSNCWSFRLTFCWLLSMGSWFWFLMDNSFGCSQTLVGHIRFFTSPVITAWRRPWSHGWLLGRGIGSLCWWRAWPFGWGGICSGMRESQLSVSKLQVPFLDNKISSFLQLQVTIWI